MSDLKNKIKAKGAVWMLKGLLKEGNGVRKRLIYFGIRRELDKKENKIMIENFRNGLAGKKTYLVAVAAILGAVISFSNGDIDATKALELGIEAVLACTLRAGMGKS